MLRAAANSQALASYRAVSLTLIVSRVSRKLSGVRVQDADQWAKDGDSWNPCYEGALRSSDI